MVNLGFVPRDPHIVCDGCGAVLPCLDRHGMPRAFMRNGTKPPGWTVVRNEETLQHRHYCKQCTTEGKHL
jgi:hypothetical protein